MENNSMSGFKRSPSKVFFASDSHQEYRDFSSGSPGSQDSGFSDTENHSHKIPKDIFKNLSPESRNNLNLSKNYVEKTTPNKSKITISYSKKTPVITKNLQNVVTSLSEPTKTRNRYTKYSPKVSRSLFLIKHNDNNFEECKEPNQYSKDTSESSSLQQTNEDTTVETSDCYNNDSNTSYDNSDIFIASSKSCPAELEENEKIALENQRNHQSAPAVLYSDESITSFNTSLSSDNESELECLFSGKIESPKHTSTPKICADIEKMRQNRREPQHMMQKNLFLMKFQHQEARVPPIHAEDIFIDENAAVQKWLTEARLNFDSECMTTLQCKSIIGELQAKVTQMAACTTTILRGILSHSKCIEMEFKNLQREHQNHIDPIIQSLTCNILDYLKTHLRYTDSNAMKLCDEIRATSNSKLALKLVPQLYTAWQIIHNNVLSTEINHLVEKLEDPSSETDLRATVTGITSLSLRNPQLIEIFVKCDIVPILLILCEKCEGSSLRTLLLRALSTTCSNTVAIRQFEKFSGLQLISDTIEETSRPEPERSEAVALLAQITAPWLDNNYSTKGLQEYSKKLVKSLTKFAENTKCCQNLLLCSAALANLSSMEAKTVVKYMLQYCTVEILLEAIKNRGEMVSIYLYEQLATLLANMSAIETTRKQLIHENQESHLSIVQALLYFLNNNNHFEETSVSKRLQQKCIIALSRFCGDKVAAKQVVRFGGVEKLVKICREKEQRFDSDAVLVAALATLRKIADACGNAVLSAQDAQELVEPKLLDSFLAYSTQNESYV